MNQHISSLPLGFNVNSENVLLAAKNTTNLLETPRKIPFKDATNKASELLRSAMKPTSFQQSEQLECTPLKTQQKQKEVGADYDESDFDPFVFPPDNNCFCCGDNRKTDGEIWGKNLVLNEEFMEQLMSNFGPVRGNFMDSPSPPNSPIKLPRRIEVPPMSPVNSFVDASYKISTNVSCSDDSDSELDVPDDDDFDMDFSLENDEGTGIADSSIIQSW